MSWWLSGFLAVLLHPPSEVIADSASAARPTRARRWMIMSTDILPLRYAPRDQGGGVIDVMRARRAASVAWRIGLPLVVRTSSAGDAIARPAGAAPNRATMGAERSASSSACGATMAT